MRPNRPDLAIAGGGLAGSLVALAFAKWRPEVEVVLSEAGPSFGGNHIWSLFDSDLSGDARALVEPLIVARWESYDIAFPERRRTLPTGYASITSERLDEVVREALGSRAVSGVAAVPLDDGLHFSPPPRLREGLGVGEEPLPQASENPPLTPFASGRGDSLPAAAVLDARGPGVDGQRFDAGWQKFLGQMLRLDAPHGLTRPIVMDATVAQIDGYRFVYVLPFGPDTLFVEDTYYSDTPAIDLATLRQRIEDYATARGWRIVEIEREESGALPVTKGGRFESVWPDRDRIARVGARAGAFHPTTGYSLPRAAETAVALAKGWPFDNLAATTRTMAEAHWNDGWFYRLLDRMLFDAAPPEQRYRVLQHFYRLPVDVVERFYAGKTTRTDMLRILSGRPPVPIAAALQTMMRR